VAAVALTALNASEVMSGLALQFLSAEADKEYIRSKCLRHMNLQTVIMTKKILTGAAELSHGLRALTDERRSDKIPAD
jgi:hypothetical protein